MVFVKQCLVILLLALLVRENQTFQGRRRRRRRRPRPLPPPCLVRDCQVTNLSGWSSCSHRCGNAGTQSRTRSKIVTEFCGGSCPYHLRDERGCNINACQNGGTPTSGQCYCRVGFKGTCCEFACFAKNCQVSTWSGWSSCSHKCGNNGNRSRSRYKTVNESCWGSCPHQLNDTQSCNRDACHNGGTPANGRCYCRDGFTGTCCEFVNPKIYFNYVSPLHPTVYKIIKGSLTGVQKVFDDPNHNTIAKNDQFTVLVNVTSPIYNTQRQWYEMPAVFCFGENIKECVNKKRPFGKPYLVKERNVEIAVPFMIPFKIFHNKTLSNGKTIYEAGNVHNQFRTFEVNGARYDTSTGLLASFSAKSSIQAGQISGIEFTRNKGIALIKQPMIQCYFVEWSTDGCVPGLNNMMLAYDIKFMQINSRRWLKPVDFPRKKDERYLQTLTIPGTKQKNYLVFKDMILDEVSENTNPFSHVFQSLGEQLHATLQSVRMRFRWGEFLGSGKYGTYSKYYSRRSSTAAVSGVEYHFFRANMSSFHLEDENNWDDSFKNKWKIMLNQRKKGNAMDFFREYGTHYVFEALMGGRQETLFTVDYCEINKGKSQITAFEEELKKPYKLVPNNCSIEACFKSMVNHSSSPKSFISGPETTCIGGNSFDSDVCYNITLWKQTVLTNPWPIRMTLKPFYALVKDNKDRKWMDDMYQEYLRTDLDEKSVNHDKSQQLKCSKSKLRSHGFLVLWCIFSLVVVA